MTFLKQFLLNPLKTGAVAPSSKGLVELITDTANLSSRKCVVEFGSGSGIFTEKIIEKINPDTTFFSIEINNNFVQKTKDRCPDATVYLDSALNIEKYLNKNKQDSCDCIISGLPLASFSKDLQAYLIDTAYGSLSDGGVFLTFAYIQGSILPTGINLKKLLKN